VLQGAHHAAPIARVGDQGNGAPRVQPLTHGFSHTPAPLTKGGRRLPVTLSIHALRCRVCSRCPADPKQGRPGDSQRFGTRLAVFPLKLRPTIERSVRDEEGANPALPCLTRHPGSCRPCGGSLEANPGPGRGSGRWREGRIHGPCGRPRGGPQGRGTARRRAGGGQGQGRRVRHASVGTLVSAPLAVCGPHRGHQTCRSLRRPHTARGMAPLRIFTLPIQMAGQETWRSLPFSGQLTLSPRSCGIHIRSGC
jgi:hypothetical protein